MRKILVLLVLTTICTQIHSQSDDASQSTFNEQEKPANATAEQNNEQAKDNNIEAPGEGVNTAIESSTDEIQCPEFVCSCSSDSDGKITADCSSKYLQEIPKGIDGRVTRLLLKNNRLKEVPKDISKFKDLEELNVENNDIESFAKGSINELPKLRILKAANNRLTQFPEDLKSATNWRKLEELDFGNNYSLEEAPEDLFTQMKSLQSLTVPEASYKFIKNICDSLKPTLERVCTGDCEVGIHKCTDYADLPEDVDEETTKNFIDLQNLEMADSSIDLNTNKTVEAPSPDSSLSDSKNNTTVKEGIDEKKEESENANEVDVDKTKLDNVEGVESTLEEPTFKNENVTSATVESDTSGSNLDEKSDNTTKSLTNNKLDSKNNKTEVSGNHDESNNATNDSSTTNILSAADIGQENKTDSTTTTKPLEDPSKPNDTISANTEPSNSVDTINKVKTLSSPVSGNDSDSNLQASLDNITITVDIDNTKNSAEEANEEVVGASSKKQEGGINNSIIAIIVAGMVVVVAGVTIGKNWKSIRNRCRPRPSPNSAVTTNGISPEEVPLQNKSMA